MEGVLVGPTALAADYQVFVAPAAFDRVAQTEASSALG
jgi:hypothetical protein